MIPLLILIILFTCLVPLAFTRKVWYDKKSGMKHTFTDSGIISEWDFNNPLTLLRMLNLSIQSEGNTKQRNKYIHQYSKLKKSLKKEGYDVSGFQDYKIN